MATSVQDLVEKMKKSQGFLLFVSTAKKDEITGEVTLDHDYMRQQFIPEDLEKSFENFSAMLTKDLSDSGVTLIKSAEKIVNAKSPIDTEHTES